MRGKRFLTGIALAMVLFLLWGSTAEAVSSFYTTEIIVEVRAEGQSTNWDGVANVSQFTGTDGNLWFAVDSESAVTVYKTVDGNVTSSVILQKQHPTFGTALCDSDGNFYVVTGEKNETDDYSVDTIFITKYDPTGRILGTVGDHGVWGQDSDNYTKIPFEFGNCDAAISGTILTVYYARQMYNGHQSSAVFSVDICDLSKVKLKIVSQSHSFAQRVVPMDRGFIYAGQGDCNGRAFEILALELNGSSVERYRGNTLFDFWVEEGTMERYDMGALNNTFANMGGIAVLPNGNVAFVATSVQSLSSEAYNESKEIFIQIFDPFGRAKNGAMFVTEGTRSGVAGANGNMEVTNYGVEWLTDYGTDYAFNAVQVVPTDDGKIVILYELNNAHVYWDYYGLYYMVLDENGNVIKPATLFSKTAKLNRCETPVYANGKVWWVGNVSAEYANENAFGGVNDDGDLYIFGLDITKNVATFIREPSAKENLVYNGNEQELVDAGSTDSGTVMYALADDTTDPIWSASYSTQIPTAILPGTYYVYYCVQGDASHMDTVPVYQKVVIKEQGTHRKEIYENTDWDSDSDQESTTSGLPDYIENEHLTWVYSHNNAYWYENGYRQGTMSDTKGILGDGTNRGREVYDSETGGWYWLDACYDGAKAEGKEVWIPYVYQDELVTAADGMGRYANGISDEERIEKLAAESNTGEADMSAQVADAIRNRTGKWVRYDENGCMLKGWVEIVGALAECYPKQEGNIYYYDQKTGLMAKGYLTVDGEEHYFDEITGVMQW